MTGPVAAPATSPDSGALRRIIRRPSAAADTAQRCELCNAVLPERHRHLLDEQRGEPLCACQACTLLFEREAAGRDHYRLIPDRRRRLAGFPIGESDVPVGLVFYVRQRNQTVIAHYPSPIGSTQCEVDSAAWQKISQQCPEVDTLLPVVEAVLVNTARGADDYWIVPVDDCYRLVALIRQKWRGLSGGSEVWPAIDGFFADLDAHPTSSR